MKINKKMVSVLMGIGFGMGVATTPVLAIDSCLLNYMTCVEHDQGLNEAHCERLYKACKGW